LIPCELAAIRIRHAKETNQQALSDLQDAIVQYGSVFCAQSSCAYSDLTPYIEILGTAQESSESLLGWAGKLFMEKGDMDRSWLRKHIFAIQVTYKVLASLNNNDLNQKWLPDWRELVKKWRASQKLGTSKEGEGVRTSYQQNCC
jgi:hypothetical protein